MIREIDGGGSSHLSQNSVIAHFGLGDASKVDSVIVTWVGGKKQMLTDQNTNQKLTITEVEGANKMTWWVWALLILAMLLIAHFLIKRFSP